MRKLFVILIASTAIALLYGAKTRAATLDRNGDGVITRAEFDAARRHDYRLLDKNRNKALSRREFYNRGSADDRARRRQRSARFRAMDRDDDGGISPAEYRDFGRLQFRRLDRNRDGKITAAEYARTGHTLVKKSTPAKSTPEKSSAARSKLAKSKSARSAPENRDIALARKLNRIAPAARKSRNNRQLAQSSNAFSEIDVNRDGVISRGEFKRALIRRYRVLDRHPNKTLSRREYYRRNEKPSKSELLQRRRDYRRMDKDDDGGLSIQEYLAYAPTFFARLDTNRDRRLDRRELAGRFGIPVSTASRPGGTRNSGAKPAPRQQARAKDGGSGDRGGSGAAGGEEKTKPAKPEIPSAIRQAFTAIDKNKDGAISKSELNDARLKRFNQYDRNLDWGLSKREFVRDRPGMARRFAQMDSDRNGKISWKEYQRAGDARFKSVDRNGDRKISLAEFAGQG